MASKNINNRINNKEKLNNKNKIIIFVTLIILVLTIVIFILINKTNKKTFIFEYVISNNKYNIKISNGKVDVSKDYECNSENCNMINNETFQIKYSDENYKKLENFIRDSLKLKDNENKIINIDELDSYTKNVILSIHQNEYLFETEYEKYKYKIEYINDDYSKKYNFYFKDNNTIKVKIAYYKNDKIEKVETSNINFSKVNMEKLFNFAKIKTSNLETNKYTKNGKLDKSDKNIFSSLINNDEKYLSENDIDLLYEIKYTDIKCPSPILRLYSDNTYEYYSTYNIDESDSTPKTGKFDYDVQSIVEEINQYKCDKYNVEIKNNSNYIYETCLSNKKLNKFLNEYNFKLNVCISIK